MDRIFATGDGLDGLRLAIAAMSVLVSVVYLRFAGQPPSPLRAYLKTSAFGVLALLPLSFLSASTGPTTGLVSLAGALFLSALGDWFLAATDQRRYFVPGLVSFLLAHVVFVITFLPLASAPGAAELGVMGFTFGASGLLIWRLMPRLGSFRVPVIAYFLVINLMICVAVSSASMAGWVLGAGAILFAFSDSLIAIRKFLTPFRGIDVSVWATYAVAQYMICLAVLGAFLNLR